MTTIKKILTLSLCLIFVLGSFVACSRKKDDEHIEYYLLPDETGYGVKVETSEELTELVIPETYEDKPIKEVQAFIFKGSEKLKSVTIPEGVENIYVFAFSDCSSLKNITLPRSTKYIYLDLGFSNTELRTIQYAGSKEEWRNIEVDGNFSRQIYRNRPEIKYLGE